MLEMSDPPGWALALNAEACATCSGEPCRDRCPLGLDIAKLTRSTQRMLD